MNKVEKLERARRAVAEAEALIQDVWDETPAGSAFADNLSAATGRLDGARLALEVAHRQAVVAAERPPTPARIPARSRRRRASACEGLSELLAF